MVTITDFSFPVLISSRGTARCMICTAPLESVPAELRRKSASQGGVISFTFNVYESLIS